MYPLVPSEPQNLMVMLSNSILTISWDPPSSPNGVVSYEVNITISDLATGPDVVSLLGGLFMSLSVEPFCLV